MVVTFFVERERETNELIIMRDDGRTQTVVGQPYTDLALAQRSAENAAHAEVRRSGGQAMWTVKPDAVAQREYDRRGENGSRSAWVVTSS